MELTLPSTVTPAPVSVYRPLPQFPASERDLALIVPEGVTAGAVSETIRSTAGDDLEALDVFDLYSGEGVPDGTRSIAFRLRFRSPKRTLKDKEVDRGVQTVLRRLEEELGVTARG
jgi:phenylalanyl-tRNA synthetase beta chain